MTDSPDLDNGLAAGMSVKRLADLETLS